jgi:hypothetical protein
VEEGVVAELGGEAVHAVVFHYEEISGERVQGVAGGAGGVSGFASKAGVNRWKTYADFFCIDWRRALVTTSEKVMPWLAA